MIFDKEKNNEERKKFIELWANYIKTHTDKEWSKQQNIIINSQIQNVRAIKFSDKQFERLRKLKIRQ